jgi:rhodanese-related sulfurtransferase
MQQISTRQLADWLAASDSPLDEAVASRPKPLLLDVREAWEYELCHLAGSLSMPMRTVPARLDELDASADVVVICHHGARSMQVAMFLAHNGFSSLYNLAGGVNAWAHDVDPAMRKY